MYRHRIPRLKDGTLHPHRVPSSYTAITNGFATSGSGIQAPAVFFNSLTSSNPISSLSMEIGFLLPHWSLSSHPTAKRVQEERKAAASLLRGIQSEASPRSPSRSPCFMVFSSLQTTYLRTGSISNLQRASLSAEKEGPLASLPAKRRLRRLLLLL